MKHMNWSRGFFGVVSIGVLLSSAATPGIAQELPKIWDASVPRERQIEIALSAAPAEVSSKATVYVLGPKGYEKAREGTNGFSCLVGRHFTKPTDTTVEPICFDAEGSRTDLMATLREEELRSSGKSEAEIKTEIADEHKDGRLKYPSKPGFLYMMSSENRLGGAGNFPPHLMFYAPNMTLKDMGFDSPPQLDYLGMTEPGAPGNRIVVVPTASTPPAQAGR